MFLNMSKVVLLVRQPSFQHRAPCLDGTQSRLWIWFASFRVSGDWQDHVSKLERPQYRLQHADQTLISSIYHKSSSLHKMSFFYESLHELTTRVLWKYYITIWTYKLLTKNLLLRLPYIPINPSDYSCWPFTGFPGSIIFFFVKNSGFPPQQQLSIFSITLVVRSTDSSSALSVLSALVAQSAACSTTFSVGSIFDYISFWNIYLVSTSKSSPTVVPAVEKKFGPTSETATQLWGGSVPRKHICVALSLQTFHCRIHIELQTEM